MGDATLLSAGDRPVLRLERHVHEPLGDVWRSVTEPEGLGSWFPTRIVVDEWRVGAPLEHRFDDQDLDPLPGRVLAFEPPHRVSLTWGEDPIDISLSAPDGGGTTIVLTEQLSAAHVARNAAGWDACLDLLCHRDPTESWSDRFDRYVVRFEPILGPQEGPPSGVDPSSL